MPSNAMHPLQQQVHAVAARAGRLRWMHAAGKCLAGVVVLLAVVFAADFVLRLQDAGLRWLLSLAALACAAWWVSRTVIHVWRTPPSLTDVARRIEVFYPQLKDRLTSALEFLEHQSHRNAGSAELQRAVISETHAAASELDLMACVNPRNTRRSVAVGLVVASVAMAVALSNGALTARAAQRLVMPWGGPQWPRVNDLKYLDPVSHAARGEEIVVRVVDAAKKLPDRGLLEVWYEGDAQDEIQTLPMTRQGDTLVAPLNRLSRTVSFRASAGDDRLSWWTIEMVEPPALTRWATTVTPPAYTRAAPQVVGDLAQSLIGAELTTSGELSRPVQDAALVIASHQRLPLTLSENGRVFQLATPWRLDREGDFQIWLEVSDASASYQVGRVQQLRVAADTPPNIAWELPTDGHSATASSQLPLRGIVKDNMGIESVTLIVELPNRVQRKLSLFEPTKSGVADILATRPSRIVDFEMLQPLKEWGVRPGDELRLRLESRDFQPDATASLSVTNWRLIRVVSSEQMLQLVGQQQAAIFQQLEEVLELTRTTGDRTSELLTSLSKTIRVEDRQALQTVELQQRRVTHGLGGAQPRDQNGLIGQVTQLLEQLRLSGEAPEARNRLADLKRALEGPARSQATSIERQLVAAVKNAVKGEDSSAARKDLNGARGAQRALVDTLESLLTDARQWTSYQQAAQELGRIIDQQIAVQQEADRLHVQQLTSPDAALAKEQGAKTAQDQAVLGRRFDKLLAELRVLRGKLQPEDQQIVDRAVLTADSLQISSDFRSCASLLQTAQWGRALESQDRLLGNLRKLLGALTEQRASAGELEQLANNIRKLEQQVSGASDQWRELGDKGMTTEGKRRAGLMSDAARDLATAARELAPGVAELIIAAHFQLAKVETANLSGAAAADESGQAAKMLSDAAAQIASQVTPSDRPAPNVVRQLRSQVESLLARQALLLESVRQLTPDADLDDLLQRRKQQLALATELQQTLDGWDISPVLQAGLALAQPSMARAADELQQRRSDAAAAAMTLAINSLELVQSVLQHDPPASDSAAQSNTTPSSPPTAESDPDRAARNALRLPELKMLTHLQQDLLDRTAELNNIETKRTLNSSELRELSTLAARQGRLADWLNSLLEQGADEAADPGKSGSSIDQLLDSLK